MACGSLIGKTAQASHLFFNTVWAPIRGKHLIFSASFRVRG
jgi:hypothetical protein